MIWHNLKLIFRRIFKEKGFSGITIFGLVIGIFSFLILFLYVANEKSFDKHFTDYKNIYRVISIPEGRESTTWARSLGIINKAAVTIPEIVEATQFSHCQLGTIKMNEQSFQQKDIMSVDASFIKLFSVESKIGNLSEISNPNTAFISEDFANKYFKNENPIGKSIEIEALQYVRNLGSYEIRGVVKNTHPKTHFNYHILLSQKGALNERYTALPGQKVQWVYNYLKLRNDTNPKQVSEKLLAYFDASNLTQTRGPKKYDFNLIPLADIHLKSDFRFELKESSSKINIGLFIIISMVILLVSLLNFINLTVAKLIKRSKELGLKKSVGANKIQLTSQILFEVLILCVISIAISLSFIEIVKPFINQFFEVDFNIYYSEPIIYLSIIGVLLVCLGLTALFVGLFLFRKTTTLDILSERNNFSGSTILKSLLVLQVTVVIILISSTLLVNKQIGFISEKSLGFDKENVVVLNLKDNSKDAAIFANELQKQSSVLSVGFSAQHFGYPAQGLPLDGFGIDGTAEFVFANYNYLKTMNIQLIENWIIPSADTISGMVINNHLYKRLMEKHGSMEDLNAFQLTQELEPDQQRINFIGVAKDFNYQSAHDEIGDFAFWLGESQSRARFIHIRINPGNLKTAMNNIKDVWNIHYPGQEFSYFFMDEKIAQQYKAETILSRILSAFSALGILISIIGISALSLFISQQRTKEIGIRKVNGAKVSEILTLLNKDFIKWVAIAFVVACPIAYYAMNKWLENFAYKTTLSWWIFVLAGVLALGIALLTVSWQSWRAATRNPVEALRYE